MKISPKPENENERLKVLKRLQILDTEAEQDFDDIVKLASAICETPMSLVGLIDESRQWYKAKIGMEGNEADRDLTFCSHALHDDNILVVADATKDDRFFDNPFVVKDPKIKFYAGVPLITAEGYTLGTLCVIDTTPKMLDEKQFLTLRTLGRQVMKLIELRLKVIETNEARLKAEEATAAKSQFLSMMSHEIRTPMNAIVGLTNLLLQDEPLPKQIESLKLLRFSGENLLTIINDILDFSKIEADKLELEYIDVNLKDLATNIYQMLRPRADEKGIELVLDIDEKIPLSLKADQVRLSQVITNLVGNAVKFTEKGYVQLSIKMLRTTEDQFEIRFQVKDTGIGIEEDKLQHIFESFSQASSDTARKFGGTGLGLSITKKLLALMNTTIEVSSAPGYGSEFTFQLLMKSGEVLEKAKEHVPTSLPSFNKNAVKVLVVDDNRINQIVAGNFLKKWAVDVDLADDGFQAIEKMKDKSFHLILMDVQMPGIDGFETTRKIRALQDAYFKSIPIVALTAGVLPEVREKALACGMDDLVSKPFQPDELRSVVGKYAVTKNNYHDKNKVDLYSEGDPGFKRALAGLLIKNIRELKDAFHKSRSTKDAGHFDHAAHKTKPALKLLGDEEFILLIDSISSEAKEQLNPNRFDGYAKQFEKLCDQISNGLQTEA